MIVRSWLEGVIFDIIFSYPRAWVLWWFLKVSHEHWTPDIPRVGFWWGWLLVILLHLVISVTIYYPRD